MCELGEYLLVLFSTEENIVYFMSNVLIDLFKSSFKFLWRLYSMIEDVGNITE